MGNKLIGIDIGGTSVKIGVLDINGSIIQKWEIKTRKENKGINVVSDIWKSINAELTWNEINNEVIGIGVGAPGFVSQQTGMVYEAVNIGWKNYRLKEKLQSLTNLPVFVENDANLAALGENWKGAGNNTNDIIVITLGTGVGSGIIANGELLSGINGTAGEIGHIIVDRNGLPCNCRRRGCLDTIASGPGVVYKAMKVIEKYPTSDLAKFYESEGDITSKDVFQLARKGNQLCQGIVKDITDILGYAIAAVSSVTNPSKILIGGGLSNSEEQLLDAVNISFEKYSLPRVFQSCKLEIAKLGNDAGIIGAAYLVKKLKQSST
ncbi:ROK family glucokinase [Oceanobacillus alkalisoli]|uniref:ROK family glucokinase n=1 Tax=Oceanobacillus alkalisoli TaxID=2925113 RepID=UPI001EEFD605|nr:ROK family glucokinase [Oceanobacillus alkalisoli]MCF3944124.1 ROK family glucokinase [Oceanobacillus alkalisoli]MCG5102533.1 ROK family glucokinase [Oceanobacillus alkalisoli]